MTKQILRKDKRIHKKRIVTEEGKSLENGRRNEERKRRDWGMRLFSHTSSSGQKNTSALQQVGSKHKYIDTKKH